MQVVEIWHPHPETGEFVHFEQHTFHGKRTFFTNGKVVAVESVDDNGLLIPRDKKLKSKKVLSL